MKAFGLAVMLGVAAASAPACALEVTGASGFLGEWEVTATVTETASGRTKNYRGPLVMKHIGLCTQDGPVEKKGEMRLQISASSQLSATLSISGTCLLYTSDAAAVAHHLRRTSRPVVGRSAEQLNEETR